VTVTVTVTMTAIQGDTGGIVGAPVHGAEIDVHAAPVRMRLPITADGCLLVYSVNNSSITARICGEILRRTMISKKRQ
jgi:hypothetical protein